MTNKQTEHEKSSPHTSQKPARILTCTDASWDIMLLQFSLNALFMDLHTHVTCTHVYKRAKTSWDKLFLWFTSEDNFL